MVLIVFQNTVKEKQSSKIIDGPKYTSKRFFF